MIPTDISDYENSKDKKAAEVMMERVSADYNLLMDNCAQAVLSALEAVGVPTTVQRDIENSLTLSRHSFSQILYWQIQGQQLYIKIGINYECKETASQTIEGVDDYRRCRTGDIWAIYVDDLCSNEC